MPYRDPDERRRWDRMRKRRERAGRAGGRGGRSDAAPPPALVVLDGPAGPVRLRCAADLVELMEDELGRLRAAGDAMSPGDRARTATYMLGVAARLLELGPLEERLTALERALGEREPTRRHA